MDRHYKNRSGQGKAAANGFLMNRVGESLDSGESLGRQIDKSVWIQIAFPADAETAPLRHPEHYQYDLALPDIAELWRRGSVIGSWILDLTARALGEQPELRQYSGRVSDSGEGRWTAAAAIESGTPAPVLTTALFQRFSSRGEDDFPNRLLSAMRYQFGGHHERPADK